MKEYQFFVLAGTDHAEKIKRDIRAIRSNHNNAVVIINYIYYYDDENKYPKLKIKEEKGDMEEYVGEEVEKKILVLLSSCKN